MKTSNRIINLIWVVIALSAIFSVFSLFKGISQLNSQPLLFWMTVIKLASTVVLLLMSFNMRKIVLALTSGENWQESYHRKMKMMGYMAIGLVLINAAFHVGYEMMWKLLTKSAAVTDSLYNFRRFYAVLFTESPAMWVLALSIFLFAELVKAAHKVKTDYESII